MPHTTLKVYDMKFVDKYNDYYEQTPDPNAFYEYPPSYTKSDLFGRECHFIFFGEVLSCDNYVFKEEYGRTNALINWSCHILKLSVERSIYGNLKRGQEVYLLCRWHHESHDSDSMNNFIQEGKKGIFITNGLPVKIYFAQKDKSITAIGSLRHNYSFHYYLTSMLPENPNELDGLRTKQDVISYWEENGMLRPEEG